MKLTIRVTRFYLSGYHNLRISVLHQDRNWYTAKSLHGFQPMGTIHYQAHDGCPNWYGQSFSVDHGQVDSLEYMTRVAKFLKQDDSLEFLLANSTEVVYFNGANIPKKFQGFNIYKATGDGGPDYVIAKNIYKAGRALVDQGKQTELTILSLEQEKFTGDFVDYTLNMNDVNKN